MLILGLVVALGSGAPVAPCQLSGSVHDAYSGEPVADATVSVGEVFAQTDAEGKYTLASCEADAKVTIEHPLYFDHGLAHQRSDRSGSASLLPKVVPDDADALDVDVGATLTQRPHGTNGSPGGARVSRPDQLPETIRVARWAGDGNSCVTGGLLGIDELDFEDYVAGVVYGEIAVFRGVDGGGDAAYESFKAFAVAARTYALHFLVVEQNAGTGFDINDTACNQRYVDDRDPLIDQAVQETAGQVLAWADNPALMERYFYAASCGHVHTQPGHAADERIPDDTDVTACVGTWCGHQTCAGHDGCLVWGSCQWGSVERAVSGQTYDQILGHYQPHTVIVDYNEVPVGSGFVTGVVVADGDPEDPTAWVPATVTANGEAVTWDALQPFSIELPEGVASLEAESVHGDPASLDVDVVAGETAEIVLRLGVDGAQGSSSSDGAGTVSSGDASDGASQGGGASTTDSFPPGSSSTAANGDDDSSGVYIPSQDDGDGGCRMGGTGSPALWLGMLGLLGIRRRRTSV